jgi:protein-L-isoaspartate(D-aspartate) O-methyltransferase
VKTKFFRSLFCIFTLGANCFLTGCSVAVEPDLAAARERMAADQLAGRDITNQLVLQVMRTMPRHEFVPQPLRGQAYDDHPLPIGYGQTISQPYIVGFMSQALNPQTNDVVLEVETGSGYQAAVLASMVEKVYTIEIIEPLARRAETDHKRLGFANVQVRAGDGYQGWTSAAPFDAIIVTCAPDHVPQPLVDQQKEGGRMIIPVGPAYSQTLYLLRKRDGKMRQQAILPVLFVPMTGLAEEPEH